MPHIKKKRYMDEFNLSEYDAKLLTDSKHTAEFFEKTNAICKNPKIIGIIPKQIKVIKKYFIPSIIILNSKVI